MGRQEGRNVSPAFSRLFSYDFSSRQYMDAEMLTEAEFIILLASLRSYRRGLMQQRDQATQPLVRELSSSLLVQTEKLYDKVDAMHEQEKVHLDPDSQ